MLEAHGVMNFVTEYLYTEVKIFFQAGSVEMKGRPRVVSLLGPVTKLGLPV